jgi:quercetin dioxygenase-like cupin family protein
MLVHQIDSSKARLVRRPEWFNGTVRWQVLAGPVDENSVEVLAIFFDAGAGSRAQRHTAEEVLHVIDGEGMLVTEDELVVVKAGDVVVVPAGVWHWHGASPSTAMCQIVVGLAGKTEWWVADDEWPGNLADRTCF